MKKLGYIILDFLLTPLLVIGAITYIMLHILELLFRTINIFIDKFFNWYYEDVYKKSRRAKQ